MGDVAFRYSEDERAAIAGAAPKTLTIGDWDKLKSLAIAFQNRMQVIPNKKALQIEQTSRKLSRELLKTLSPLDDRCLWSPEFSVWLKSLGEVHGRATELRSTPKSQTKAGNRARPETLEQYLIELIYFYAHCGGHAGKAPDSPCSQFVTCAAAPAFEAIGLKLKFHSVSAFIRARLPGLISLITADLETSLPELGSPTLTRGGRSDL